MKTVAIQSGDQYTINGSKTFITNGSYAETLVVMAKTDTTKGTSGISAFVVDRGAGGISVGRKENKLGMRASDTVQLIFDDVKVPKENLLGKEGDGFKQALEVLDSGRIGIAALSVGLAQGALDASLKYAKERQTFGKALAEHQAIQFKLADMVVGIEAARLLTFRAAQAKVNGQPINLVAAQAKYFASEAALENAIEGMRIHGAYGYSKEFDIERLYRDAPLTCIGEGTNEMQRIIISKQWVKRNPA